MSEQSFAGTWTWDEAVTPSRTSVSFLWVGCARRDGCVIGQEIQPRSLTSGGERSLRSSRGMNISVCWEGSDSYMCHPLSFSPPVDEGDWFLHQQEKNGKQGVKKTKPSLYVLLLCPATRGSESKPTAAHPSYW